jgi:hypothetical protein
LKYWLVEVYDASEDRTFSFGMLAPEHYNAKALRKMIKSVHPEYERLKFKKKKRPDSCKIFLQEKKKVKKRISVEEKKRTKNIGFAR